MRGDCRAELKKGKTMEEQYDICILSVKGDAELAQKLADSIHRYRLPRGVVLPEGLDYRRILIRHAEDAFDEEARERLRACRFLALVCSPETRSNPGILDRVRFFRHTHGKECIIAILARGEPIDSFPESFIEKKKVRRILPDLSVTERVETIEPVAADLRTDSRRRWREVLRYETVRITASVLGLHPDALEQRHRSRRRRAILTMLSVIGAICLSIAGLFLRLGYIAKTEGDIAARQTQLSLAIAYRTMTDLPAAFSDEPQALAYIDEAVENARAGLDELGLGALLDETETGGGA
jgi:hypothetical protein